MKKIITFLVFLSVIIIPGDLFSQTAHPFELGFNAGASWLHSDVKMKKLGGAGGFTFGQSYCMNATSPLFWGWRFRYLSANAYGQDFTKSYGIANNNVLNGQSDTVLNYYSNGGYVYQNYKTHLNEVSLELMIGANKMRERTHFYPYIFGGIGLTKATVKTNQLNGNNQRYNYSQIDSNGNSSNSEILSQLNNMYDGTYETSADGNRNPRWKFMPSLGLGLGYEVVKGFSIGLEHKMTWALNDVLDGQQWSSTNSPTGNNDMYHYTSFWIKFSFGRAAKNNSTASTATTTTTDATNYTNTTTTTTTTTTVVSGPVITLHNPAASPYKSTQQNFNLNASITNINSISDINLSMNGNPVSGFTYNSSTGIFLFPVTLMNGANTFVITAANQTGSTSANVTVVFQEEVSAYTLPAPAVTITSPAFNPYTTSLNTVPLNATITNVTAASQVGVSLNGSPDHSFSFNPGSHQLSMNVPLIPGSNVITVSATTPSGSDSKTENIIYSEPAVTPKPIVTITNPTVNPFNTNMNSGMINASILNITSAGQLSVTVNGTALPASALIYNPSIHKLGFTANFIAGANTIVVSATNVAGGDSKTETVIYSQPVVPQKPIVTITNPSSNPFNTSLASDIVNATIMNITSAGQVTVAVNGTNLPASALNYNLSTFQLGFNANFIPGANTINVSATNVAGADSKSIVVIYTVPVVIEKPVITITNPSANPYNTIVSAQAVHASITNITSVSQISVLVNGTSLPGAGLNFNPITHELKFAVTLILGSNSIVISATNVSGADSKTQTINYTQPVAPMKPIVTITNPATSLYTTSVASQIINATIINIVAPTQITVTLNGNMVAPSAWSFNMPSHQLSFTAGLIAGANVVTVSATTSVGSDTKTETVIYTQPVEIPKPVITIINPATNPSSTAVLMQSINAMVMNISSAGQISVMFNGNPLAASALNYDASSHQLNFNLNLIAGANTITITATNSSGSDSKTQTINYAAPVMIMKPSVSFIDPSAASTTVSTNVYNVVGKVMNVASQSNITVKLNGANVTAFIYNTATKKVSFGINLNEGANTVMITGTNASGSDSKTITINYVRTVDVVHDTVTTPGGGGHGGADTGAGGGNAIEVPKITFITPSATPYVTVDAFMTVIMKVENITGASNVEVKINNAVSTSVTYSEHSQSISFPVHFTNGLNVIKVNATNTAGTKSETLIINKH